MPTISYTHTAIRAVMPIFAHDLECALQELTMWESYLITLKAVSDSTQSAYSQLKSKVTTFGCEADAQLDKAVTDANKLSAELAEAITLSTKNRHYGTSVNKGITTKVNKGGKNVNLTKLGNQLIVITSDIEKVVERVQQTAQKATEELIELVNTLIHEVAILQTYGLPDTDQLLQQTNKIADKLSRAQDDLNLHAEATPTPQELSA